MINGTNDEKFISENVLKRIFSFNLHLIHPISLILTLSLKNMIVLSIGQVIILPLFMFEILYGMFLTFCSFKVNKNVKKNSPLPYSAIHHLFKWIFNKKKLKEMRIIHSILILEYLDVMYIFLYGFAIERNPSQPVIFILTFLALIESFLFVFVSMMTIIFLNKDQVEKEIKMKF